MQFFLIHPWALVALVALPLPLLALATRRHRRVVVPSLVIHRMIAREAVPLPRRIPWALLALEAAGLAALVLAMALPFLSSERMRGGVTVVDNSLSGTGIAAPGGEVLTSVPGTSDAASTHVPGDITSALFQAALARRDAGVTVLTRRKAPGDLPAWMRWKEAPTLDERHGITGMWVNEGDLNVGILRFGDKATPIEAVFSIDGREVERKKLPAGQYVTAGFRLPQPGEDDRLLEVRLDPEDGFTVDDMALAVQRSAYHYRTDGRGDALVGTALRALGWVEADDGVVIKRGGETGEAPGVYIIDEGEEMLAGRTALGGLLARGGPFVRLPEHLNARPVGVGAGWVPVLYVEGRSVAAVDPAGRRVVLGFAPDETAWRDNPGWVVLFGMMFESAGYPLGGISWHVTGETTPYALAGEADVGVGEQVLLAGAYKGTGEQIEAYNAFWPEEMAVLACEAPPVVMPSLPQEAATPERDAYPLDGILAIAALLLLSAGAALKVRRAAG